MTPTIADTPRSAAYAPVAASGPFPVPFPIFDAAGADLRVTLNGVVVTGWTYTGTLAPGFYGSPNTYVDGAITFASPITGALKITGRRRPRRTVQYAEGVGVPARNLNYEFNVITAVQREQHDRQEAIDLRLGDLDAAVDQAEDARDGAVSAKDLVASLQPGTITTGAAGSSVVATVRKVGNNLFLDLTIPRGDPGTNGGPTNDASQLTTGLLAAARIADASLPIAKTNGLQTALDAKASASALAAKADASSVPPKADKVATIAADADAFDHTGTAAGADIGARLSFGTPFKAQHRFHSTSTASFGSSAGPYEARWGYAITREATGGGFNGPYNSSGALLLGSIKTNYLDPTNLNNGEIDGLYVSVRQGVKADVGGILVDARKRRKTVDDGTDTGGVTSIETTSAIVGTSDTDIKLGIQTIQGFLESARDQSNNPTMSGGNGHGFWADAYQRGSPYSAFTAVGTKDGSSTTYEGYWQNAFTASSTRAASGIYFQVTGPARAAVDALPAGKVMVPGAAGPFYSFLNETGLGIGRHYAGALGFYNGGAVKLLLDGAVLLPAADGGVQIGGSAQRFSNLWLSSRLNIGNAADLGTQAKLHMQFGGGGSEYGAIMQPAVNGTNLFVFLAANGSTVGSIGQTASSTSYNTTSDIRLKTELEPIDSGRIIDSLEAFEHGWLTDPQAPRQPGLSAQSMHAVVPTSVTMGDEDETKRPGDEGFAPWVADYSKLVPVLVAELQSVRRRLAELEGVSR